ncbi:hypothetical protein M427DRAFT_474417 [Gonapodya prolifera JEL478]|uniref:SSD domain-containing protein n=1 Tax=Gonapodya prolifera (strain JEL478) TaxID=1344416 RepID=A0A139ARG2_GONPJ|nr:hypothetical protein M427DRAFT_474417 [Gonapodya prolifera JEL478]|eukprot:KXS19336.1 hypothetical protein M427DRAFT_474417 [Gonapodya prolifera JEL478]
MHDRCFSRLFFKTASQCFTIPSPLLFLLLILLLSRRFLYISTLVFSPAPYVSRDGDSGMQFTSKLPPRLLQPFLDHLHSSGLQDLCYKRRPAHISELRDKGSLECLIWAQNVRSESQSGPDISGFERMMTSGTDEVELTNAVDKMRRSLWNSTLNDSHPRVDTDVERLTDSSDGQSQSSSTPAPRSLFPPTPSFLLFFFIDGHKFSNPSQFHSLISESLIALNSSSPNLRVVSSHPPMEFANYQSHTTNSERYRVDPLHVIRPPPYIIAAVGTRLSAEHFLILLSYILVFLYISLRVGKVDLVKSKFGLGFVAVLTVVLSLVMSVGLCGLLGIEFSMVPWEVFPFLIILVGVENMSTITSAVVNTSMDLPVKERVGRGLGIVGVNISVSLGVELAILVVGAATNIPAFQEFSLFAAVTILMDYFLQLTFFTTVLSIDIRRLEISTIGV